VIARGLAALAEEKRAKLRDLRSKQADAEEKAAVLIAQMGTHLDRLEAAIDGGIPWQIDDRKRSVIEARATMEPPEQDRKPNPAAVLAALGRVQKEEEAIARLVETGSVTVDVGGGETLQVSAFHFGLLAVIFANEEGSVVGYARAGETLEEGLAAVDPDSAAADGYLRTNLEEIADRAPEAMKPVTTEELEEALATLQLALDPPGVAARNLRECLLLQLDALEREDGLERETERLLIGEHLDDMFQNRLPKIAQKAGLGMEEITDAIKRMRRLEPAPGSLLVSEAPPAVVADAILEWDEEEDRYIAYLNDRVLPNLRINKEYAQMVRDREVDKSTRDFIRTNISNAEWLLDAVEQRKRTLVRVLNVVAEAQRDFFDQGPQALRPLPMTQVADQLGVHVATVSRAVSGKYVQTPRGVFPLRRFFSGGTQTDAGEDVSWDAIKAALQEVVDAEDKSSPLSDEALADALKEKGIDIARRTVAKYRSQLGIPSARMRKKY